MSNKLDYLHKICDMARQQCRAAHPALDLHFVIHMPGQLAERMAITERAVSKSAAARAASSLFNKTMMVDRSSLLGLAAQRYKLFFGLYARDYYLGLININTDDITDSRQARHLVYHLMGHAIAAMKTHRESEERVDGPIVPKRTPLGLAIANLKADIFAAMMNALQGHADAPQQLAQIRAHESIIPYRLHRVEDFPYIMAAEATQYAFSDLQKRGLPSPAQIVQKSFALADDITRKYEEAQIRQWWSFAAPAQNMAWAGHTAEEILGAAVNTSENPYIRATGYLVAQFADIAPLSASTMMSRYNSFTSFERNERLHRERMEDIFEAALSKSLQDKNGDSLLDAANTQNEKLAEGSILGWCAHALQAAGKVFESAIEEERMADEARHQFNDQKEQSKWGDLVDLSNKIVEQKRDGYAVTMSQVAGLCDKDPALSPIAQSVQMTLSDPAYIRKLQAANDLTPAAPMPRVAQPAAAPKTPAPSAAPSYHAAPGLGLGGSGQMVRARMLTREKRLAEQQAKDTQQ